MLNIRILFPPSAVTHHFFIFVPVRSSESGLGSGSKSSAMKFCIEWSNRELLGPSRRRDMASSLFLSAFGGHAPIFVVIFHAKSGESDLGSGSKSSAMRFCIDWSNRELLRLCRRRDMTISFISAFGSLFRLRRFFPPSAPMYLSMARRLAHGYPSPLEPAFVANMQHIRFFVICLTKSGESDLGGGSKSCAMQFCIEWSNRELLRPSRRRDMIISLFRLSALFSAFGDFFRLRRRCTCRWLAAWSMVTLVLWNLHLLQLCKTYDFLRFLKEGGVTERYAP